MKVFLTLLTISITLSLNAQQQHLEQDDCYSDYFQEHLNNTYPELIEKQRIIEDETRQKNYGPNSRINKTSGVVYTIPVVVHVVHYTGTPIGTAENISDNQVIQAIAWVNDAFRNVGYYNPQTGADVEIEFCLATQDTSGNFTIGITRTANDSLTDLDIVTEKSLLKSIVKQWPPTRYCNLWVVDRIINSTTGAGVGGFAPFAASHGSPNDGVVIIDTYCGSDQDKNKKLTHEFGHYLNLYHTFQSGCTNNDCTTDGDKVCDTPPDNSQNQSCASAQNTCATDEADTTLNNPFRSIALGGLGDQNDMIENYMDRTNVSCRDRFSEGQKTRMRAALTGPRASLLSSNACNTPTNIVKHEQNNSIRIFPNPMSNGQLNLVYSTSQANEKLIVQIYSINGLLLKNYALNILEGINNIHFNLNDISEGIYILRTSNSIGEKQNLRFVVIK